MKCLIYLLRLMHLKASLISQFSMHRAAVVGVFVNWKIRVTICTRFLMLFLNTFAPHKSIKRHLLRCWQLCLMLTPILAAVLSGGLRKALLQSMTVFVV